MAKHKSKNFFKQLGRHLSVKGFKHDAYSALPTKRNFQSFGKHVAHNAKTVGRAAARIKTQIGPIVVPIVAFAGSLLGGIFLGPAGAAIGFAIGGIGALSTRYAGAEAARSKGIHGREARAYGRKISKRTLIRSEEAAAAGTALFALGAAAGVSAGGAAATGAGVGGGAGAAAAPVAAGAAAAGGGGLSITGILSAVAAVAQTVLKYVFPGQAGGQYNGAAGQYVGDQQAGIGGGGGGGGDTGSGLSDFLDAAKAEASKIPGPIKAFALLAGGGAFYYFFLRKAA